jgi:hypothetical protein
MSCLWRSDLNLKIPIPPFAMKLRRDGAPGNIEEGEALTIIATALVDKLGKARNNAEFLQNMNAL